MERDEEFEQWLYENRYGEYNGFIIEPTTQLVSYQYVISIIVISFTLNTRYYFVEAEKTKRILAMLGAQFTTLLLGWWGIPHGFFNSFISIISNFGGGNRIMWGGIANAKPKEGQLSNYK